MCGERCAREVIVIRQEWLAIVGSLRQGSYNRALFEVFSEMAPAPVVWQEAHIETLPFYNPDLVSPPEARQFWNQVRSADAIAFFTPEYNGSIPAVLKNAIDWASRDPEGSDLNGKPAVVLGASQGLFGTLRSQLHLRQILSFVGMDLVHRPEVLVSEAHLKLEPHGQLNDPAAEQLMKTLAQNLYRRVGQNIAV